MTDILKLHQENKDLVKLIRKIDNNIEGSNGYILGFSDDLILIQNVIDFDIDGYSVFPTNQIDKIRFNRSDKYFNKMMQWEKLSDTININYQIRLNNWRAAFSSLKENNLKVIVECESSALDTFTIGSITKVGTTYVYVKHFDATGLIDEEETSIDYASISKVTFDSRYINIFSKYLRRRKKR
ncbi:hypothetical protein C8P68_10146 [Mucilaginibacter yixingensis]|uniref:Uncharacterized protein n=1 Tax=Mucilaginibacter yixingensis TaxID=1295612 RepID=A0A2T5JEI4_9SPHI|nr:hypothetical protein [Mucilaginibacter yixingensis]PTR00819.1 hypothetical protein C8P68_10146 [Mucilaginibacter yixingensis]